MMYIKIETINEGILRAAIRFACANNGTTPDECYEVIGRKILNGELTAICASWHNTFVAYYQGAAAFYGPASGYQERDARIAELKSRPDVAEVLRRVRRHALDFARPHGIDECSVVDVDTITSAIDAELASLTGPKKPTKPRAMVTNCTICGCPNERAFLDPCANQKHNFEAP